VLSRREREQIIPASKVLYKFSKTFFLSTYSLSSTKSLASIDGLMTRDLRNIEHSNSNGGIALSTYSFTFAFLIHY
jgi:hypothetical protein